MSRWATEERTIVVLGVRDEDALRLWAAALDARRVIFESFREPDIGGQLTALAVHPAADARLFRKLPLL